MTSQANQRLEEKTKPIESFDFKAHQLSEGVFEKILVSNNLNKIKTDSYYFTSDTDTYQEPGQGHVETYHHRKEKRNLMKDQELLLAYSNHQEWEFTKDGYDPLTTNNGSLELFKEDPLARKIFEQAKSREESKQNQHKK